MRVAVTLFEFKKSVSNENLMSRLPDQEGRLKEVCVSELVESRLEGGKQEVRVRRRDDNFFP